jgi:hypothetical protein
MYLITKKELVSYLNLEQLDLKHKVTSNFRHLEILQPKGFEPPQYANSTYSGASYSSMLSTSTLLRSGHLWVLIQVLAVSEGSQFCTTKTVNSKLLIHTIYQKSSIRNK